MSSLSIFYLLNITNWDQTYKFFQFMKSSSKYNNLQYVLVLAYANEMI
jgi:hypothetical protein